MSLDPEVIASALATIASGIVYVVSRLNKQARRARIEQRRSHEAIELYAGYTHTLRVQLQENGITPRRMPVRLQRLIRQDDEDEDTADE